MRAGERSRLLFEAKGLPMRVFVQRERKALIAEITAPTRSAARWAVMAAQEALVPTAPAVEAEGNARVGESEISPPSRSTLRRRGWNCPISLIRTVWPAKAEEWPLRASSVADRCPN